MRGAAAAVAAALCRALVACDGTSPPIPDSGAKADCLLTPTSPECVDASGDGAAESGPPLDASADTAHAQD